MKISLPSPFCTVVAVALLCLPLTGHAQDWQELIRRADSLSRNRAHDSAAVLGRQSLRAATRASDVPDTAMARLVSQVGSLHAAAGRTDSAADYHARAVALCENAPGECLPALADYLDMFASDCVRLDRYDDAEKAWQRALGILKATQGTESENAAGVLNNLGILYRRLGRYHDAEEALRRSLSTRLAVLGPEHQKVAGSYQNLGNVAAATGRYDEAESYFRKALAIKEKGLKAGDPSLANTYNGLAIALAKQGRYAQAEPLYEKALAIQTAANGPRHPAVADALSNLAILQFGLANFDSAAALDRLALAIREEVHGPRHTDVAISLNNLGNHVAAAGHVDEAVPILARALDIRREAQGDASADVAEATDNLADLYRELGRYAVAESLYTQALAIHRKAVTDPAALARLLRHLAGLYMDAGRLEAGARAADSAWTLDHATLPSFHPALADDRELQSRAARLAGNPGGALVHAEKALEVRQAHFRENAWSLPEDDVLRYAGQLEASADSYFSCYVDAARAERADAHATADAVLNSKGPVSDEMFFRHGKFTGATDTTTDALWSAFKAVKYQIAQSFVRGGSQATQTNARLDSLRGRARDLEAQLARRTQNERPRGGKTAVSAEAVQAALPPGSILVEYRRFSYVPAERGKAEARYLVLLLKPGSEPLVKDLGKAAAIDDAIQRYRDHLLALAARRTPPRAEDAAVYRGLADTLYRLVWQPVAAFSRPGELLFVAPDGGLNLVSFGGLKDPDGEYVIEERSIQYLSAGRDLLRPKGPARESSGLLALGDPDFDCPATLRVEAARAPAETSRGAERAVPATNVRSVCGELSALRLGRLPETRTEVEAVASAYSSKHGAGAVVYLDRDASEERLKREAGSYDIIHAATHGYFLEGRCGGTPGFGTEGAGENPLLYSGLLLAGANLHGEGSGEPGAEDGILTADEASALDLRGTRLVVLSACETGIGKVREGEGIYGLRRAFMLAGARSVVSALWPVADADASRFMKRLYGAAETDYPALMRAAARSEIREQRLRKRPDHPLGWAAFVATGDWRTGP